MEVPLVIPVTIPVVRPIAMLVAALLQVPPTVALLSVIVKPAHTCFVVPVIGNGSGLIVTVAVVWQPVGRV